MNIPKNKKYLILGILKETGIIFVVFVLTFIAVKEFRVLIDEVNKNIYANNEANTLRDYYKETYDLYHRDIENMIEADRIISTALPPTEDIREFVGILNTLGTKNGTEINVNAGVAQIDSIKYGDIPLRSIPILINVSGQLQNVRNFVSDIEKLPYFFTITSIDERSIEPTGKQRADVITAKLWTKPEQVLTRTQSQ